MNIGDGDRKKNSKNTEKKKFGGDYPVTKEDCIGHIQKHMEAAIRMHKSKDHGQKLSDGKTIDRKGRLTDNIVDSIPTYCGQTISSNICNLKTIQGDVLAINYHIIDGLLEESLELTTLFVLLVRSHGLSLSLIKQMLQIFIISISFTFHSELNLLILQFTLQHGKESEQVTQ